MSGTNVHESTYSKYELQHWPSTMSKTNISYSQQKYLIVNCINVSLIIYKTCIIFKLPVWQISGSWHLGILMHIYLLLCLKKATTKKIYLYKNFFLNLIYGSFILLLFCNYGSDFIVLDFFLCVLVWLG